MTSQMTRLNVLWVQYQLVPYYYNTSMYGSKKWSNQTNGPEELLCALRNLSLNVTEKFQEVDRAVSANIHGHMSHLSIPLYLYRFPDLFFRLVFCLFINTLYNSSIFRCFGFPVTSSISMKTGLRYQVGVREQQE